jgi:hypothetical protein
VTGQFRSLGSPVADAAHDQRVGETGHPEADPPLRQRFLALLFQGEAGDVDGIVHHADGSAG